MRRYYPLIIAGVALIAAACNDAIAPERSKSNSEISYAAAMASARGSDHSVRARGTATPFAFDISPDGNTVTVGGFTIRFPDGAVCQAQYGYGPGYWNLPCQSETGSVHVTGTIYTLSDRAFIDFDTDIRFNPNVSVFISVDRPDAVGSKTAGKYEIVYFRRQGNGRSHVDEASNDPSLRSFVDPITGEITRRVKHFSGYSVSLGKCTDEYGNTVDPSLCSGGGRT